MGNTYIEKIQQIQNQVNQVVKGKAAVVEKVLAAMIGGGHVLMEDLPGVGKTTLATTFAKAMSLDYKRVQFTPDVLPSDIVGFSMYNNKSSEFEFQQGAVFCNLFLADEINRTSPKTQSALLEVMEERQVSVEGTTRRLPEPFIVIATQNPSGSSGTQLLPESQMDRFMVCLSMGYPAFDDAVAMLKGEVWKSRESVSPVISAAGLQKLQAKAEECFVHDAIYEYIVKIVEETRTSEMFAMGASPRAAIALLKMSRAIALMQGRDFVTAENVQMIASDVLNHRIKISSRARADGLKPRDCVKTLLGSVKSPRI